MSDSVMSARAPVDEENEEPPDDVIPAVDDVADEAGVFLGSEAPHRPCRRV